MLAGFLIITLIIQVKTYFGQPVEEECCASKNVGGNDYTLTQTTGNVPTQCLNACTYANAMGNLFCFARGNLPVKCTGENAVSVDCYPRPPGPGCPPDDDTKITNQPDRTLPWPDYTTCWNYCKAICSQEVCNCYAWSYDKSTQDCNIFAQDICYTRENTSNWISGGPCFGNSSIIGNLEEEMQSIFYYGPFGGLPKANILFDDYPTAGVITSVEIFTGSYNGNNDVIVGIKFSYGGQQTVVHGNEGVSSTTCDLAIGAQFTKITIYSINSGHGPNNLIYYLGFTNSAGGAICGAGRQTGEVQQIPFNSPNEHLLDIFGWTSPEVPPMLGRIWFVFGK